MWVPILISVVFLAIGFALDRLKWYFLISGYNTMSKEKKARVDIESTGHLMGIYSYVSGGVFLLAAGLQGMGLKWAMAPAFVYLVLATGIMIWKANRFDGNLYDEDGHLRTGAWRQLAIPMLIFAVSIVLVTVLLFLSAQPTKVTLGDEGIQIHGVYGDVYPWGSVESVTLLETLPVITARTNGAALGSRLKGNFSTKEYGSVKLFIDTKKPPFIFMETWGKRILFSLEDPQLTRALFQDLKDRL